MRVSAIAALGVGVTVSLNVIATSSVGAMILSLNVILSVTANEVEAYRVCACWPHPETRAVADYPLYAELYLQAVADAGSRARRWPSAHSS